MFKYPTMRTTNILIVYNARYTKCVYMYRKTNYCHTVLFSNNIQTNKSTITD